MSYPFYSRAGKIYTRQNVLYNPKTWKSIEVIKKEGSYVEIMLITHHQKTIPESFFSCGHGYTLKLPHSLTLSPTWVWWHTLNPHLWAGSQGLRVLSVTRMWSSWNEAHGRRWVEMKSLILVSPAQWSHQPNWSISLSTITRAPFPGGNRQAMHSFASGSLRLLLTTIWRCSFHLLVLLANFSSIL